MRKYRKLDEKFNSAIKNCENITNSIVKNTNEFVEVNKTRLENYEKLDEVVDDIDKQFAQKTSILNPKDQVFLWTAVALQTCRWFFMTDFKDRISDKEASVSVHNAMEKIDSKLGKIGGKKYKDSILHKILLVDEHSNRNHKLYNPSLEEIITNPVPFDTINGAKAIGSDIAKHGGHRYTVLGHDPVLGWIFGTANIATSTLTDYKFQSYHIETGADRLGRKKDWMMYRASTVCIFENTKKNMFDEGKEGKIKVAISLLKEAIHLKSDVQTAKSLPIPVISVFDNDLAGELAEYGFDMENIETVGKQFAYALMINVIIKMIHFLLYNKEKDGDKQHYKVRTRKILATSMVIAESLNIAYVSGHVVVGLNTAAPDVIMKGLKKLDIGGCIEAIHQIVSSASLQEKIRREFLEQKLYEKLVEDNYSFLTEEENEQEEGV